MQGRTVELCTPAKRILIVEDDSALTGLLAYNLRRAGYEVVRESNGRDGFETAVCRMVDLALMDLMLSRLDRMAAIKEIEVDPLSWQIRYLCPCSLGQFCLCQAVGGFTTTAETDSILPPHASLDGHRRRAVRWRQRPRFPECAPALRSPRANR